MESLINAKTDAIFEQMKELSPAEQVYIYRVLGEALLVAGNPFEILYKGMTHVEAAIEAIRVDAHYHSLDDVT